MAATSTTPAVPTTSDLTTTRIRNPRLLLLVRAVVLVVLVTEIVAISTQIPRVFSPEICQGSELQCNTNATKISIETVNKFAQVGLSIQPLFIFSGTINTLYYVLLTFLSVLLFWRRSDDWMALLSVATFALLYGNLSISVSAPILVTFVLLFPTGRFQPRWTILLVIINALFELAVTTPPVLQILGIAILFGILMFRYRRVFSPIERQQTKWLLVSFLVTTLWISIVFVITPPLALYPLYIYASYLITLSVLITIPVTVWLAILRYRLWEVDLVINRSLVYGGLTLLLGGIFIIAFLGLNVLWQALLGNGHEVIAAVLPAVFITLIFNPTRKRVQNFVDRRIYHLNFDLNQLAAAQKLPDIQHPGALSGRKLGDFTVLDAIGKGGMGEVYKGQHGAQTVALKILPDDLAGQEQFRQRFEREAQTLTALHHPHIVQMIASGESDGVAYMAMEFIDGEELGKKLKSNALSLDDTLDILRGLASALDYAHEQGFVHRDIKPSNVMLRRSKDGETWDAVLMDFGIAKIREAQSGLTGTGAIGTIDYMAPEQISLPRKLTAAPIFTPSAS